MSENGYKESKRKDPLDDRERLTREDKKYLNSKARVIKRAIGCVVEYIIIVIMMMAIACFLKNGNLDNFMDEIQGIMDWFQPGGMLFNAIVGFIPVMAIGCIGAYFGEGTVGKLAFGLIRCVAILVWLLLIFDGAETSLELPEVMSGISVEDLTIGLEGLSKLAILVMTCSLLIPIGEFTGARKKHKRALAKKNRIEGSD